MSRLSTELNSTALLQDMDRFALIVGYELWPPLKVLLRV